MPINWDEFEAADAPAGATTEEPKISWEDFEPAGPHTAEGLPKFETKAKFATEPEGEGPSGIVEAATRTFPSYLPPQARNIARKIIGTLGGGAIEAASEAVSAIAPKSKVGQIAKGVSEAQTDNAEFFTSPLGIATLGIGTLPKMAQRAVSLGFATQMASQTPELSKQLGEELGKPEDDRDYEKIAKLVAGGAATIGFTAGAGVHGLAPSRPPIVPPEGAGGMMPPPLPGPGGVVPVAPPENFPITLPPEGPRVPMSLRTAAEREAAIPTTEPERTVPNAETIRRDQGQLRPPRQEPQGGEALGGNDIQQPPPGPPNAPGPEAGQAPRSVLLEVDRINGMNEDSVSALKHFKGPYGGGQTALSYEIGASVKTPAELDAILKAHDRYVAELAERRKTGNLKGIAIVAAKKQLFTEAYEAATGHQIGKPGEEGSALKGIRHYDPNYQPPMAPKSIQADVDEYARLTKEFKDAKGADKMKVWAQLEAVKNRHGGKPPVVPPEEAPAPTKTEAPTVPKATFDGVWEMGPGKKMWQYTFRTLGEDPAQGMTFYVPEGTTAEAAIKRANEKLEEFKSKTRVEVPKGKPPETLPPVENFLQSKADQAKARVLGENPPPPPAPKPGEAVWMGRAVSLWKQLAVPERIKGLSPDNQRQLANSLAFPWDPARPQYKRLAERLNQRIAEVEAAAKPKEPPSEPSAALPVPAPKKPTPAAPAAKVKSGEEAKSKPSEKSEGSFDVSKGATEIKGLVKADVKSDPRLDEPGVTRTAKPNSLVVQFRDRQAYPVGEVTLPLNGDAIMDHRAVMAAIKRRAQSQDISFRESGGVSTGPNGRAIRYFSSSGWTAMSDLIAKRGESIESEPKQLSAPPAPIEKPKEIPAAKPVTQAPAAQPEPEAKSLEAGKIESYLSEPVQDVTEQRARLKLLQQKRDVLNKEYAGLDAKYKSIGEKILLTRGPKYMRGRIKQSAKASDKKEYGDLQKQMADLRGQMHQLDQLGRDDQQAVDRSIDAEIISNPKNSLLRRLDRKVRLLEGKAPAELVDALRAESARVVREKYPDATPEEVARLQPEVERSSYFDNDPWKNPQIPDLQTLRVAALDAELNKPTVPKHQFPEELKEKLDRVRRADRTYGGKIDVNAPIEPLTAKDLASLKGEIESATKKIHNDNAARVAREAEEKAAEQAKETELLAEAQKVADSAKRVGTVGGRTAKEVKADLVARVAKAIGALIERANVTLKPDDSGGYIASSEKAVAFGTIEQGESKFKVSVKRIGDKEYFTVTVATGPEAEMVLKAMASEASGHAIIGVPGDGVYKLLNSGKSLLDVWKGARSLDTGAGGGPAKYTMTGISRADAKGWMKEAASKEGLLTDEQKEDRANKREARPITDEGAAHSGPAFGVDEFVKKDVAPFLKKGIDAGKALVDIMVDVFSPASRTASRDVDELFQGKGFKEKIVTRASAALDASKAMFDKLSEPEQIAFIDRVKRGQRQPTPELQRVANLMRKWDDRLYVMAKRYKPGLPYLENHNRVLWKVVPGSPEARGMSQLGVRSKRPWQGSKGFMRRHVLDDMSQGIEMGGVPVTYNPVEMFLLHAQDVMKFVAANRAWEGLKNTGSVEWVRTGQKPPDGYVRISDNISKPYFRTPTGLLAKTGEWYAEEGAARMIENYLSRDYIRTGKFGPVGRSLLALKNATTAIELGLSPFHAVFESNEVMGSSIGLGIAKIASGKLSGVKDILGAPFSPKTTSRIGKLGIQYAKNPTEFSRVYPDAYKWFTSKYPEARKLINDLFAGGGQPAMHEEYRVRGIDGFKKAVGEGNYPGAVLRAFPALNELAMKPLFQTYIPRLKVGMFLREYSFELERNSEQLASGKITRPELARKTWAFIEDRFGELNFDNLYWDRTFKSAMQIMFRSVTWKLGNLRGFGKATRDIWMEGLKPLTRGEKPRITMPVAWLAGMALVTSVQASIISKVSTGKYPWELAKDGADMLRNLVFPRIDPDDERQRVSIPTYWRDLVHLAHSPTGYVGSSMTGEWRRLYDDLVNRDFFRHPIYNPNDPMQKKVVASLEHLVPLPFGLSSFIGATQEGVGPERAAAGFMGFTKAPSYVSPSSQNQLRDLAMKWKTESGIPKLVREAQRQATEQFEPSDYTPLRSALRNRNYDAARTSLDKLLEDGHKPKDIYQAMRPLNQEGKPKPFTGSQIQEKYFLQSLTPEQRELYRDAVRERIEIYKRFNGMLKEPNKGN